MMKREEKGRERKRKRERKKRESVRVGCTLSL